MNWVKQQVEKLQKGEQVQYRPKGNSMQPKINSGELVTVSPDLSDLDKGDIVLCKVSGKYFTHLVSAIKGEQFQISNNKGHVNGWITKNGIFGRVINVEA